MGNRGLWMVVAAVWLGGCAAGAMEPGPRGIEVAGAKLGDPEELSTGIGQTAGGGVAASSRFQMRAALGAFFTAATTGGEAPSLVPVSGVLADAEGMAIEGDVTLTFAIYAEEVGGTAVFREHQVLRVEQGRFDAYVGAAEPLSLEMFRDFGETYVGVTVEGDRELSPRIPMGTVPYAAFARHAADADRISGMRLEDLFPPGALMMFDRSDCPVGWSDRGIGPWLDLRDGPVLVCKKE